MQTESQQQSLARAFAVFNETSQYLSRSYQELQERVADLTRELAVANCRLNQELSNKDALSRRLAALIDALPGGVLVLDGRETVAEANPAAVRLLGAPLVGENWAELRKQRLIPTRTEGEWRTGASHDALRVSVSATPLDDTGASVLLINDITQQHLAQQQEARRQRLASMGEMSANLAHQLRTPLATCLLYGAQLGEGSVAGAQRRRYHDGLMNGLRHLERLVRDMLAFVRGREGAREAIGAGQLLHEVTQMMQPQAQRLGVTLHARNLAAVACVRGCRKSLVGALCNLVENALHACQADGNIELCASAEAGMLRLVVRDDGRGIAPQARQRLFEPFFTTRAEGSGLGLAIVRSIARAHGGDVDYAEPNCGGSEFIITLPVAAATRFKELHHA